MSSCCWHAVNSACVRVCACGVCCAVVVVASVYAVGLHVFLVAFRPTPTPHPYDMNTQTRTESMHFANVFDRLGGGYTFHAPKTIKQEQQQRTQSNRMYR